MIDVNRLRPRISPLDVWRIVTSFLFVGFGVYFVGRFLFQVLSGRPAMWSQLLLGGLILLYGLYRVWSAGRNYRRMQEELRQERQETEDRS